MKAQDASACIVPLGDLCRTCLREVDVPVNIFRYMFEDRMLISQAIETCLPLQVSFESQ